MEFWDFGDNKKEKKNDISFTNSVFSSNSSSITIINGKVVSENNTRGNGKYVSQNLTSILEHTTVEELVHDSLLDINLTVDPELPASLILEAEENICEFIRFHNNSGKLKISSEGNYMTSQPIKVTMVVPELKKITLKGSGNIKGSYYGRELNVTLDGMGDIKLHGIVEQLIVKHKGMGSAKLSELCAEYVDTNLDGMGNIKVWAIHSFSAKNSGMGNISVVGEPKEYNAKNDGMGDIKKIPGHKPFPEKKTSTEHTQVTNNTSAQNSVSLDKKEETIDNNLEGTEELSKMEKFKKKIKSIL